MAMRSPNLFFLGALAAATLIAPAHAQQATPPPAPPALPAPPQPGPPAPTLAWSAQDVVALARVLYPEGIPVDVVQTLLPRATAERALLGLLNNRAEQAAWPNVVGMLGLVGGPASGRALMTFIGRAEGGPLSSDQARAKSDAVIGLGYLVQRTGDKPALDFLVNGVRPQNWGAGKLSWNNPALQGDAAKARVFANMSMIGLGVTGHPDAQKVLKAIAAGEPPYADIRTTVPGAARTATEAVANNDVVRSTGLLGLYKLESRPNLRVLTPGVARTGILERSRPVAAAPALDMPIVAVTQPSPAQIIAPPPGSRSCVPGGRLLCTSPVFDD